MFRATGDPNTNPDTLQAFQRTKLRMLIANSDEIVPISNPNVEIDNEFDFVTSGLQRNVRKSNIILHDEFECEQKALEGLRKLEEEKEREEEEEIESFCASRAECSEQGLIYVGGFLCHKLAKLHPWMGSRTCDLQYSESNKWMEMLSRGGLYIPSDELKQYLEQFEYDFALYHNPSISLQENSIMIFANILKLKHPTLPMDMLRLYSKTRFFIRLKFLNNELAVVEKSMKRRYVTHINKFA